jgi:uncharacterized protein VirK/YbjX
VATGGSGGFEIALRGEKPTSAGLRLSRCEQTGAQSLSIVQGPIGRLLEKDGATRLWKRLREMTEADPMPLFLFNHLRILVDFSLGTSGVIARQTPRITSRYVRPYLSRALDVPTRRRIFLHHYNIVKRLFTSNTVRSILNQENCLWSFRTDELIYRVSMEFGRTTGGGGDILLAFFADSARLYELSFSIGPTDIVGDEGGSALFVGSIQGVRERFESIRRATKHCRDISPAHLLLSAAEGFALALSVPTICGVSSDQQVSRSAAAVSASDFSYDKFWLDLAAEEHRGWYVATVPLRRKPLASVATAHRRRARHKRQFKDAVAEKVRRALLATIDLR